MTGLKSRWFVEIFLDGSTVRFWNDFEAVTFGGQTFQPLGDRFTPPDKLKRSASLKSESVKLIFDSSRQLDDGADILADLLDSTWRNRQIRIRNVYYTTTPDAGDVTSDTYGRIRSLSDSFGVDREPRVEMEIESGALAYLERRMQTRSAENQKLVFPTDQGFDLAKRLEDVPLIWRTKHTSKGSAQPKAPTTEDPPPRLLPIGEFVTEGTFVAHFTNQEQRKYWHRIYAIADCRIQELSKVWINGKLEISTPLTPGVKTVVPGLNSGGARCWITFYNGDPNQTADAELVSVESAWTSNHRLRGVAYVHIVHLWDSDLPEAFDYKFGGKGARFYDRRLDASAGGSGSQSLTDPSTWTYTTNPMVIADHYRQGVRIMSGSSAVWFGVGEAADVIPYAEFEDLADLCDENVALKAGGTQKRYEANGILSAADDHKTNLEKLAAAMSARAIDTGGRIVFRPVRDQTPVLTLTDDDLIAKAESEYDPAARVDDMANTIEGRFYDRNQDYKATDYPRVSDAALIAADGDTIIDTRNFDLEINGERAQRLATLALAYSRRIAELRETFLSSTVRTLKPGDWFTRESALRGFAAGKLFEVDEITRKANGTTEVVAVEVDPDQQAWNEANAADIDTPPTVDPETIITLDVPAVTVGAVALAGGGATIPAVLFSHSAYATFIGDEIEVEVTQVSTSSVTVAKIPGNVASVVALQGIPPSTLFSFRFRARQGERYSDWSAATVIATTDTYAAPTSGVADSIVGQGWGATASEGEASNAQVPVGSNLLVNSALVNDMRGWITAGFNETGLPMANGVNKAAGTTSYFGARNVAWFKLDGTTATDNQFCDGWQMSQSTIGGVPEFHVPVTPGERIYVSAYIARHRCNCQIQAIFRAADGLTYVSEANCGTGGRYQGGHNGTLDNFDRIGGFVTVPAGAYFVEIRPRMVTIAGQLQPFIFFTAPMIARVSASQVAAPPFEESPPERRANPTEDNVAAAFNGQGALATLSSLAYGSGFLTGFGTLAARGNVYFGSSYMLESNGGAQASLANFKTILGTAAAFDGQGGLATLNFVQFNSNVRLQNGTTVVTDAIVVTASGVASSVDGQGVFATANYYEQSTDPGAVSNGSIWFKTTTGELFIRRSGSWGKVANISSGSTQLSVSISGSGTGSRSGAGSVTTSTRTATVSGGQAPYSIQWQLQTADLSFAFTASTSGATAMTGTITAKQDKTIPVTVRVEDGSGTVIYVPTFFRAYDINIT